MEKFEPQNRAIRREDKPPIEKVYRALGNKKEESFLNEFTPEQQKEIRHRQQILSSLAYFIGKDFRIPVELNSPGEGWHWDFENNVIRIDPKDLLEKPMDYLRFVISHEGGHRRISRTNFIPKEEWAQPGFAFMMNAIEDPRDNNFVAESYPKFREQMALAYAEDLDFEAKAKQKAGQELGYQPRFMQAGFEYIKQWFRETQGKGFEIPEGLPDDVKVAVGATIESARDSWLRYPSRQEADNGGQIGRKKVDGETLITEYAKISYEINRDEVWPDFKKLVEADIEDQKVEELLKDIQKDQQNKPNEGEGNSQSGLPQDLKDKLTSEEQQTLNEAIKNAIEGVKKQTGESLSKGEGQEAESSPGRAQGGQPISLDSLPEELKQKLREYIESLDEEQKREIIKRAEAAFKEFEEALNEELQGKLSSNLDKKSEQKDEEDPEEESEPASISAGERVTKGAVQKTPAKILGERVFSEKLAEIEKGENVYEKYRREVLPIIEKLESELRQIFVERKVTSWKGDLKTGKRIDIKKRIQEKAKDVPVMESRAWQKREMPKEKDYAITLLNDVSGSMAWDGKNKEDVKAKIVLAEVLNRLGVSVEILGFHDELIEYQNFGEDMSEKVRERIGEMPQVAESKKCKVCKMDHNATDIGWATHVAAERLAKQKAAQKFLITLSDYQLEESPKHSAREFELGKMVKKVLEGTDIKVIGLGVGEQTEHVGSYYTNSIPNINVQRMPEELARLIKDVIANYEQF